VWKREGNIVKELPITEGYNILDDNLLRCSEKHVKKVFEMLKKQKEPYYWDRLNKVYYKYAARDNLHWENKLFMPQKYARYFIKIEKVRKEKLQDITIGDCHKEAVVQWGYFRFKRDCTDYRLRTMYAALIDEINGKGTWNRNPEVFVYDFSLLTKNELGKLK
jgi:hypothetical protein